ncbi:MAG: D-alanine--D-alanine ligase [Bacteroidota bacterium]|nr:D-alanine--D-alanine ligase [Bacteroidota bacterium]MDP4244660.1 D-alanine--D-alanine ligase [Bacteroidota bacterium]MDP4256476.1 D-alanine--D-alanine ligase [Bacteroidota bacterium]MDP4256907.1 D-alanine--D-alanine ligase [Bacteroidota bacterium]
MQPIIAFLTGGYSGEAVISYKSAITIMNNLDLTRYTVYKIDITREGWLYEGKNGRKTEIDRNDFTLTLEGRKVHFDAVLIGIHGEPGEDGKLQGYFDLLNIPYSGCDAATSALTFNKRFTVAVAAFNGIMVARSEILIRNRFENPEQITSRLNFPVFVKPNNGGSSIGMSKVNEPSEELGAAIERAFGVDDQILIEEFITGREFTVGVFRNKDEVITLPLTEVKSKKEFFDFEAKYTAGLNEETTPAIVDEAIANKIRAAAKKIYLVFNCGGVIRIDFIYNEREGEPFMLEINTVPGQSEASIVPQQLRAAGWTLKDFYSALIEEALEKGRRKAQK